MRCIFLILASVLNVNFAIGQQHSSDDGWMKRRQQKATQNMEEKYKAVDKFDIKTQEQQERTKTKVPKKYRSKDSVSGEDD